MRIKNFPPAYLRRHFAERARHLAITRGSGPPLKSHFEIGKRHFDAGRYQEAAAAFTQALEANPNNIRVLCYQILSEIRVKFPFTAAIQPNEQFHGSKKKVAQVARKFVWRIILTEHLIAYPSHTTITLATDYSTLIVFLNGSDDYKVFKGITEARAAAGLAQNPDMLQRIIAGLRAERKAIWRLTIEPAINRPAEISERIEIAHLMRDPECGKAVAFIKNRLQCGLLVCPDAFRDTSDSKLQEMRRQFREQEGLAFFQSLVNSAISELEREGVDFPVPGAFPPAPAIETFRPEDLAWLAKMKRVDALIKKGRELLDSNIIEAGKAFSAAKKLDPGNLIVDRELKNLAKRGVKLNPFFDSAKEFYDAGRYGPAAEEFNRALEADPDNVLTLAYFALSQVRNRFPFAVSVKSGEEGLKMEIAGFARTLNRRIKVIEFLQASPAISMEKLEEIAPNLAALLQRSRYGGKSLVFDGIVEAKAAAGITQNPAVTERLTGEIKNGLEAILAIDPENLDEDCTLKKS